MVEAVGGWEAKDRCVEQMGTVFHGQRAKAKYSRWEDTGEGSGGGGWGLGMCWWWWVGLGDVPMPAVGKLAVKIKLLVCCSKNARLGEIK